MNNSDPFTLEEARELWARLVAGWAHSLNASGARALMDGVPNREDARGSYEGVTRMLWGLGGWLSQPRPAELRWRSETFNLEQLAQQALVAGTNSAGRNSWWRGEPRGEYDQRTVESGQVAFFSWQTRERVWAKLSSGQRENLVAWLERFGQQPGVWRNNWALFWALNHAARKALGQRHQQATIDSALDYLEGVYCGDGWYDDASQRGPRHFDDYNWWVFGTHVLAWAQCDGHTQPERRTLLLERVRAGMAHYPFFFAADGAYSEYGRSLSYKFARLGAPLWAHKLGCWPHSPGLLRRLVGRHLRWYADRGALRANGTLRQELTFGGSGEVRETYVSTGATYWAMLAFGGLWSLPDDDPFWSAEEEPLPVEQGDFVRALPQPGWLLVGTQGSLTRYNAGSSGYYPAKYAKLAYSTLAPFNVGLAVGAPSPDSALCLRAGSTLAHRLANQSWAVHAQGWLRTRYQQHIAGGTHSIDTTIVVRGNLHLRAHRITLDPTAQGPIGALEGPAPLGYTAGEHPLVTGDTAAGWEQASVPGRAVAIARLRGYSGQRPANSWQGRSDLNSVYSYYLLPLLEIEQLSQEAELVCLVYAGKTPIAPAELTQAVTQVVWQSDGSLVVQWADGSLQRIEAVPHVSAD